MHSPYWQAFYHPPASADSNEESIPETPPALQPTEPVLTQQTLVIPLPLRTDPPTSDIVVTDQHFPQQPLLIEKSLTTAMIPF